MDEKDRKIIIGSVDVAIAIFIIITGFIVIIFSVEWNDWLSSLLPYAPQPVWLDKTTWIFFFVGITTVAYGIKRMIQDVIL